MSYLDDVARKIPREGGQFDVIVAGGGPAGIGAAVAAAGQGARTLLLEARGFLGGVAASALWMPMNRMMTDGKSRGGVHSLLVEKMKSFGPDAWRTGKKTFADGDGYNFHPDYLRLGAVELLEEAGCSYRMYSPVVGAEKNGETLIGITTAYKGLSQGFGADVVIDATGDGDVAFHAGAEMVEGREEDGSHMPVSLVFALGGVDVEKLKIANEKLITAVDKAREDGFLTAAWYAFDEATIPGAVSVNNGGIYGIKYDGSAGFGALDGNHPWDRSVVERLGTRIAIDLVRIGRKYRVPGLESCYLLRTGTEVSVRDTRRIVGEYVLTVEDARNGTEFPDVVARKYGVIDANQLFMGPMKSGFAYPYRCMIPKRIDNLLVAGRCGSATFLGHAAGKSMGNMLALGQAAGVAAARSAKSGKRPRDVDIAAVQNILKNMGVDL